MKLSIFIQAEMESLIPEEQTENVDVFFEFKTIVLLVIIIVLFIIVLTFFQQLKKANSRIKELNQKTNFSSFESAKQSSDQKKLDILIKTNKELEKQLTEIKKTSKTDRVNEVEEEIIDQKQQYFEEEKTIVYDSFEIEKPEVLFLPSPFEDSKFSAEDVSKERAPFSLYKIKLSSSKVSGELTLLEDADLSRALNSPDHYLEKACVYENAFNINATSIEVIEEGEVKLDNQDWLVISKVKIKFI